MASKAKERFHSRLKKKARVKKKIKGKTVKPRLCVKRSLKFTYAQIISDETGEVIAQASTAGMGKSTGNVESAKELGKKIADLAKSKEVNSVVFDRNGYLFHGRVAAVAAGTREAGLEF